MSSVEILDFEHIVFESPEHIRIKEVAAKLIEAGFSFSMHPHPESASESGRSLIEKKGKCILPVTLVNGFPMIFGRYPANDELKQFLNVPDGILEPKECGCCCIEGCEDCGR
ncbi:MAG TPA: arsenic metallochaperone ArsD family protein [Methanocorpusculum sp.]|nr:arsenic metallochaperone ArsD family protein [Methanocorpusculum sp.]